MAKIQQPSGGLRGALSQLQQPQQPVQSQPVVNQPEYLNRFTGLKGPLSQSQEPQPVEDGSIQQGTSFIRENLGPVFGTAKLLPFTPGQYRDYDPSLGIIRSDKGSTGWAWKPTKAGTQGYDAMMASPLYKELQQYGTGSKNAGTNQAKAQQVMAVRLHELGINSLQDIGTYTGPDGKSFYYNKNTGQRLPSEIKGTNSGEGMQKIKLQTMPNGQVVPVNIWKDTSEAKTYAPLGMALGLAAPMVLGPMATSALGFAPGSLGAAAVKAGVSGLTSGALSAAGGGNFGKGFLTGAIGSGIGSGVGALNPGGALTTNATLASGVNRALSSGLGAGAGALIGGGDVANSALRGALSGGISGLVGSGLNEYTGLGKDVSGFLGNQVGGLAGNFVGSSGSASTSGFRPGSSYMAGNSGSAPGLTRRGYFDQIYNQIAQSAAPGRDRLLANMNTINSRVV